MKLFIWEGSGVLTDYTNENESIPPDGTNA